jgi:prepilin-type N-terminal cleavage/methylation domain-containing protein
MKLYRSQRAFTLIELMVAVAIIGILTTVATVSFRNVRERARDSQRQNDLTQLKVVLSTYYNAQTPQTYVTANSRITLNNTNDALTNALKPNYIKQIPLDPLNTGNYVYRYQSFNTARDFTLYGTLENTSNRKGWGGGTAWVVDGLQISND